MNDVYFKKPASIVMIYFPYSWYSPIKKVVDNKKPG